MLRAGAQLSLRSDDTQKPSEGSVNSKRDSGFGFCVLHPNYKFYLGLSVAPGSTMLLTHWPPSLPGEREQTP